MKSLNNYFLTGEIVDISTAGQIYIPVPDGGEIVSIMSCISGTIATADADLTAKIAGTGVTGGVITVTASGSAAADVDIVYPTAANYVPTGGSIEIETDGASTNTIQCGITVEISRTAK